MGKTKRVGGKKHYLILDTGELVGGDEHANLLRLTFRVFALEELIDRLITGRTSQAGADHLE
jgi:hypothetical protein